MSIVNESKLSSHDTPKKQTYLQSKFSTINKENVEIVPIGSDLKDI